VVDQGDVRVCGWFYRTGCGKLKNWKGFSEPNFELVPNVVEHFYLKAGNLRAQAARDGMQAFLDTGGQTREVELELGEAISRMASVDWPHEIFAVAGG
jgi:hypothetical protein